MADITELLANAAETDPKMWEAIGNIPKAYYEGQDQAYKQKMRDVFSDGTAGYRAMTRQLDAGKLWERLVKRAASPALTQPRNSQRPVFNRIDTATRRLSKGFCAGTCPAAHHEFSTVCKSERAGQGFPGACAWRLAEGQPQPAAGGGDRPGSLMGF